ncbi:cell division protein ZapA [uncultured Clostridium sp.]|uniref:cell division protein ZapA n=1 Tax=uncultured Clostridium sp. TaxID=59620 RepID=UPI0028E73DF4|nr:cell division protein ZapA [uncultured Clostridium sp.]
MNIVAVRINGVEYNLKGNEKEEYLHRVAAYVDKKLKNITDNNSKLSTASAAILTAVNAVDDMLKKEEENQQLKNKLNYMEEHERNYVSEIEDLKKKVSELEKYVEELKEKNQLEEYEEVLKSKEAILSNAEKEKSELRDNCKKYLEENNKLKLECKEYRFKMQSSKYKILDLQHKLIETEVKLAKEKKMNNPMIK